VVQRCFFFFFWGGGWRQKSSREEDKGQKELSRRHCALSLETVRGTNELLTAALSCLDIVAQVESRQSSTA